jgi:protein-tyrosine phosphatase
MTVLDAVSHVRKARWLAVETPEQEAVLRDFALERTKAGPEVSD